MAQPLLTISILISNKKEYVKNCLDSVKLLLNELDAELILTDTGCENETRKIMEQYTDHIINFEWCDDFSAARNVGLKEAKGEWFLYLDDDECFGDIKDIVDFLKSPESENYNVASYVQRNYLDLEGKEFVDYEVDRILRINPKLHFEHKIHEAYIGIDIGRKKRLASYVNHYGYAYEDTEERYHKFERNDVLLEKECQQYPKDMRMRYQYVVNAVEIFDWKESIRRGLDAIEETSDSEYWDAIHSHILYCYEQLESYEEVILYGNKFLDKELFPYDRFGVYQYMVFAYWNLSDYQRSAKCFRKALELYFQYKSNPEIFNRNQLLRTTYVKDDYIDRMFANGITAAVQSEETKIITSVVNYHEEMDRLSRDEHVCQWMKSVFEQICDNEKKRNLILLLGVDDWLPGHEEGEGKEVEQILDEIIKIEELATETIVYYRKQYFFVASNKLVLLLRLISQNLQFIEINYGDKIINNMGLIELMEAQKNNDKILIADIIEGRLLPTIDSIIQGIQHENPIENVDYLQENVSALCKRERSVLIEKLEEAVPYQGCEYHAEYTASGAVTIRMIERGQSYYVIGNNNPLRDAYNYIAENIPEDCVQCSLMGIGMIWEARALLEHRKDVKITIVEEDLYLLLLILKYVDIQDIICNNRVEMLHSNYVKYIKELENTPNTLLLKESAIRHCEKDAEKKILRRYFIKAMTIREQSHLLKYNVQQNLMSDTQIRSVDECREAFFNKKIYLVAGGPSLDQSINILSSREEDAIVLCVGTVATKLCKLGVAVNFIIITDPMDDIYDQISEGIDFSKVKLLYMISANAKAVKSYQGEKYCICQKGMFEAETFAKKEGFTLFQTGGSVSTTALELCVEFKAKEVVCIGLDLAYTNNKSHAENTRGMRNVIGDETMLCVKSVSGNKVYAPDNLDIYRRWIEERIEGIDDITFINVSDGANIKGMQNYTTESFKERREDTYAE